MKMFKFMCLLIIVLIVVHGINGKKFVLEGVSEDIVEEFAEEYQKYLSSVYGEMNPKLVRLIDELKVKDGKDDKACMRCHVSANFLLKQRRIENATDETIEYIMNDLCQKFQMQKSKVCSGLIHLNLKIILYIADNRPNLTKETICGLIYQNKECPLDDPEYDWQIEIDNNKPKDEQRVNQVINDAPFRILQLSDVHYDPRYEPGALAACDEPACCRTGQVVDSANDKVAVAAGRWGDYRACDTPWEAVRDVMVEVERRHGKDIDAIYFTGDIVDHGTWETSLEGNNESIVTVLREMREISDSSRIYPILGNHEAHPSNLYAPKYVTGDMSTQWLYDLVAEEWGYWLDPTTRETIQRGGYYTQIIREGLRVIALNNNLEFIYNWWLLYDAEYPKEQLQWLHDTLLQAEKNKEKVHILAHVPPGETTNFKTWDREFQRIIERFSDIISAQFNGHSHNDEFKIFYNMTGDPVNVAFNGGSVTAFIDRNPNYKVYTVDPTTFEVINHQTWIYNLTAANLAVNENPKWFQMYSFKEDFGLSSLKPTELDNLVQRMAKDQELARRYYEYKIKKADRALVEGCDRNCLKKHLCEIITTVPGEDEKCTSAIYSSASQLSITFLNYTGIIVYSICLVWYTLML